MRHAGRIQDVAYLACAHSVDAATAPLGNVGMEDKLIPASDISVPCGVRLLVQMRSALALLAGHTEAVHQLTAWLMANPFTFCLVMMRQPSPSRRPNSFTAGPVQHTIPVIGQ